MQSDLLWDLETTLGLPIAAVGGPEPGNPDLRGRVVYRAGAGTMLSVYERPLSRSEHTAAFFVIDDFDETIAELRVARAGAPGLRASTHPDRRRRALSRRMPGVALGGRGRTARRRRGSRPDQGHLRAREFGEVVDHEPEKLHDASAEGQVAVRKRAAVDLAGRISEALGQIQTAPDPEQEGRRAEIVLTRLGERAGRLAEGL